MVLASGPDELHDRLALIFDAVGKERLWLGRAGHGSHSPRPRALPPHSAKRLIGFEPATFYMRSEGPGPLRQPSARNVLGLRHLTRRARLTDVSW